MSRVWCVWSAKTGRENLHFGIATGTWGFPPKVNARPKLGDYVVFGENFSGPKVRALAPVWTPHTADVLVGEVSAGYFYSTTPHWEDEHRGEREYPHRFGFIPLGHLTQVQLDGTGPLSLALSEGLRRAASNSPIEIHADVDVLLNWLGLASTAAGHANLATSVGRTAIDVDEHSIAPAGRTSGAPRLPRTQDPKQRKAVEGHAVKLATEHLCDEHGWMPHQVKELGKPYDLVCDNGTRQKHVEVKGTTGAGSEVEYTPNEVAHFRNCPHGADLIVVRDIEVDTSTDPYTTSGGELLHAENYTAPAEDLQAVSWAGRVLGW